ncbi:MAG: LPS-assembly protein LptD [Coxiellaceae bacterium]|nr:LPS-assembly protein LptD [Coxiellaceae bacterium]
MKKFGIIFYLILTITFFTNRAVFAIDQQKIADSLNWKTTDDKSTCANTSTHCDKKSGLCGGYYAEPAIITHTPKPLPAKTVPVQVSATGPVIFRQNGTSVLQDNVVVSQPGRLIQADKAILYRDKTTSQINMLELIGHVRSQEYGKLLVGETATYDIEKKRFTINGAAYHIAGTHQILSITTPIDAWGTAKKATRDNDGVLDLTNATYTTCSPTNPTWQLSASSMHLDKKKGVGTAHNLFIKFKKVPIFYAPYFSFPMNKERKSGFLTPTVGSSNNFGFFVGEPYYWNMAPNYDLTLTPGWYTERGLQLSENFRYLTPSSNGFLYSTFLTDDEKFGQFRAATLASYAGTTPSVTLAPYLSELSSESNQRAFFDFENHMRINNDWKAKLFVRYVTDPYYNQDFQSQYLQQNTNQLPSFGELDYEGEHWTDTFLIQAYETLHPINQFSSAAQNQYTRLPEWDFSTRYPQIAPYLNFSLTGQAVDFIYHSDYSPFTYQMPIGQRLHLLPSFSTPFNWASFYLTPQLSVDSTSYLTQMPAADASTSRPTNDTSRTLPIFNIDSGWYFDHTTTFGKNNYIQTIEPRLFYLYVPYVNQNAYPNFDTVLLPFSTNNLYSLNEFTGFDRLQNANQLTAGLTSHLLRGIDASNILTAELGAIVYFEPEKVCLQTGCTNSTEYLSPITGSLTWNPTSPWAITSQIAWDPSYNQMNNAQVGAQYHFQNNHILIFNYQFAHGGQNTPFTSFATTTNASLITGGIIWPLAKRWDGFAYTYYDLTNAHAVTQYAGLSYSTCCWAFRVIASEVYNGQTTVQGGQIDQSQFAKSVFVQLQLKGLGSASYHSADTMMAATLPGFTNPLSSKGRDQYGTIT